MIVFLLLIVVLLVGLTTAAVMGRIGGSLADHTTSQAFGGVPRVGLTSGSSLTEEIASLRFDQALRGYRMDQVDDVIDALCTRLRELESEVASTSAMGSARQDARDLGNDPQE